MDAIPPDIRHQDSAHRRGLVLGLTMAEIMVLILFMLLLALGAMLADREQRSQAQAKELKHFAALDRFIHEMQREESTKVSVSDIIQRLQREQHELAELRAEVDRLKPYAAAGRTIDDIVREIRREGRHVTVAEVTNHLVEIDRFRRDNDTLKGQLVQLTDQIKAAGRGNEFPSCWVTKDGKIQSIFELVLTGSAIKIRDHSQPDRAADRAALPLKQIRFNEDLPLSSFVSAVQPIYQWSVSHGCRFYVIRFSTVESAPIPMVNAISDYFYPDSRIQFQG